MNAALLGHVRLPGKSAMYWLRSLQCACSGSCGAIHVNPCDVEYVFSMLRSCNMKQVGEAPVDLSVSRGDCFTCRIISPAEICALF